MAFQAFEIGRNALAASRTALDVASQNVANANTPGYIRQRALLAPIPSGDPLSPLATGGGVTVTAVQRLRDQCLEAQINHQQGQLGQEQSRATSLTRLQNYFPDLNDNGISAALSGVFSSLQRLQTTPDSSAARDAVTFSAASFCAEMHTAVGKVQEERQTLESDLQQQVGRVNQLLGQVGELNAKIAGLGGNASANDLKVAREQAIAELSTACGATALDQPHGGQDVLLGGIRLVQGSHVTALSLVPEAANPGQHQVAVGDLVAPAALGGVIAGDMQVRDQNLKPWEQSLNDLAAGFAAAFNTQHRAGVDLQNQAGQDFFACVAGAEASTIKVSDAIQSDPRLIAAASVVGGAPGDGQNAAALAGLAETRILAGNSQTALEFHTSLLSRIGSETRRATAATEAREALVNSLQAQYDNQAGVSLDEEAVDVMRFQQMYTSATKLVQVADQMMAQIMQLVQ